MKKDAPLHQGGCVELQLWKLHLWNLAPLLSELQLVRCNFMRKIKLYNYFLSCNFEIPSKWLAGAGFVSSRLNKNGYGECIGDTTKGPRWVLGVLKV